MIEHTIRVWPSEAELPRERQFAWALAEFACASFEPQPATVATLECRVVDNAAVALAAIDRGPVATARAQALCHARAGGARLYGLSPEVTVHAEWAAWANAVAVRELDYHDTFLAADYSHPGDNLAPILAVAQQCGLDGRDFVRGALVAYEVQVALVKAISLHAYKKDHVAHLAPASVAGLGAALGLGVDVVYHAVNHAVHLAFSTRQSRKGDISSWKAFVPGFSGKLAVEAVDRAMRGERAPSPVYEGEDSVIAWMLGGKDDRYTVTLPSPGEAPRGILETYTKAHSAEYQAQALINLAIDMHRRLDPGQIEEVVLHTSQHTHFVIGSGANDPQKYDPNASRETLDHSIMYILAVALEDGRWHHVESYTAERARRASTVALWRRVRTAEDPGWTARYHAPDPADRAFGGRIEIRLRDGTVTSDERAVADAHPHGRHPWVWADYTRKFDTLSAGLVSDAERERFVEWAARLADLPPAELQALLPRLDRATLVADRPTGAGIFDHGWGDGNR